MRETSLSRQSVVRQMTIADVRLALRALPSGQADLVVRQATQLSEILQVDLSATLLLIAKTSAFVAESRRFET